MRLEEFELRRDRGEETPLIIRGEARIPDERRGTVIICHGFKGFGRFAFFPVLAERLAAAGLCAVTFDFSGSGIGKDRENFTNPLAFTQNTYFQELDDLDAVVAEAKVHGWIEDRYGVLGHSRGGGVAILHAALDPGVKALVTWAAIASTNRWPPEVVTEWRERGYIDVPNARTGQTIPLGIELLHEVEQHGETRLNIAAAASGIRSPWLVLHGDADETVPASEAEKLASLSDVATLSIVEGGSHTFGAKHPLAEVGPVLDKVISESVDFFVTRLSM